MSLVSVMSIFIWISFSFIQEKKRKSKHLKQHSLHRMNFDNVHVVYYILGFSSLKDLAVSHHLVNRKWNQVCDEYPHYQLWINAMLSSLNADSSLFTHEGYRSLLDNMYIYNWSLSINHLMIYEYLTLIKTIHQSANESQCTITRKFSAHLKTETQKDIFLEFLNNDENRKYIAIAIAYLKALYSEMNKGEFDLVYRLLCCCMQYGSTYSALWLLQCIVTELVTLVEIKKVNFCKCYDTLNDIKKEMGRVFLERTDIHKDEIDYRWRDDSDYVWICFSLHSVMFFAMKRFECECDGRTLCGDFQSELRAHEKCTM
eukprot:105728_1